MPTTEYPKNPNVDTVFVTDDGGKRTRAVKTVLLNGTVDYPKNSNSPDCYVTVDGKKQRALMTVDVSTAGTLEYPDNSNSTKGYVTVGGKKQRVTLTAALVGGGSSAVVNELNVTPSVTSQTFTPSSGVDGFNPVNVSAVTSAIDSNIQPDYIRNGINILGVEGTFVGTGTVIDPLNVTPSTSSQTITATGGVDGYSPINVSAVTSAIDSSIVASNIKSGVTILGVTGSVTELDGETVTITPSVTSQTITPTAPHNAITAATVNAVTSAIDSNIAASNIKSGVTILGVTGNVTELNGNTLNVTPTTSSQTIAPTSPYNAFTDVNVSAVTSAIDSSIVASNIKNGVTILGVTGDYTGSAPAYYIERYGTNGYITTSMVVNPINLTGIHTIDVYSLAYAYTDDTYLTSLPDFSNIVKVATQGLQGAFWGCTGVSGHVNMDKLETIDTQGMQYCFKDTKISSIGLKNLRTSGINGLEEAFYNTKLKIIKFQSLTAIGTNGFRSTFYRCTDLEEVWFYALTDGGGNNAWFWTLYNCTNVTVHFPKNMQSTLSGYTNITNGMGGTNTTVLYDIITSLTGADSNTYARTEKDSTGTATAWTYNSTLYYTSGTTEPVVGDTIYSDAACTNAVTTVSAIA